MSSRRPQEDPTEKRPTHASQRKGAKPVTAPDAGPSQPPPTGADKLIAKLDRILSRPILQGDYMPGPIKGTDAKDRRPASAPNSDEDE